MNAVRGFKRLRKGIKHIPIFIYESFIAPYESCVDCGRVYRVFCEVSDSLWKSVAKETEKLCPDCFIRRCEKMNIDPKYIKLDWIDFKDKK